ncbi:hypothetical protein KBC04_03285 [Candidatus Babeliales bacterium]|nr:hypothetical protein [Candidatus Babeliales bacterium]MBP9843925.1 hypothetical protein [Candidatus Babeliales bacterium]
MNVNTLRSAVLFMLLGLWSQIYGVYIIRDACLDDKNKILALYRKCNKWYSDCTADSNLVSKCEVSSKLLAAFNHGFALVVEDLSKENEGAIIAFLFKNRPIGKGYCHIVDCSLSCVDRDFLGEMLMTELYVHLLNEIKEYYPDILRVEGVSPVSAVESIAMFERCGFVKECVRTKCVRRSDGSFDDEMLLVWWNPNFDPAAR